MAIAVLTACASKAPVVNTAQQSAQRLAAGAARAWTRGDVAQAGTLYERALAEADSVEDFEFAATMLLNLALVQSNAGDLPGAHARLDRILAAPQRYGSAMQARAAARKALLLADTPDRAASLRWADAAQAACASPCELAATLANLRAELALQAGDAVQAVSLAIQGATLATAAEQAVEQANAWRLVGQARSALGQTDEAAAALAQALAIDRRLGLPERVLLDLMHAGDNELRRRQAGAAREYFERALDVARASGQRAAEDKLRQRLAELGASPPTANR